MCHELKWRMDLVPYMILLAIGLSISNCEINLMHKINFRNRIKFNASNATCDDLDNVVGINGGFDGFVAINDKYAVIGDPHDSTNGDNSGAAYIIKYNNITCNWNNYNETQIIYADDPSENELYGYSVSIFENYIIIGAYGAGTSYILKCCNENEWYQSEKIISDDIEADSRFGYSVAISNNFAMVCNPFDDKRITNGSNDGACYVFKKNEEEETWSTTPFDILYGNDDGFGRSVSISDKYAIIGAEQGTDVIGAAYIFKLDNYNNNNNDNMTWNQCAKLVPSDGSDGMRFGKSVSIDSDSGMAIVGAPKFDFNNGKAYVYQLKLEEENNINSNSNYNYTENWEQIQGLSGYDAVWFGFGVAIYNQTCVIGAWRSIDCAGEAYIYEYDLSDDEYKSNSYLTAVDKHGGDEYGYSVSMFNNFIMIGAPTAGNGYIYSTINQSHLCRADDGDDIYKSNELEWQWIVTIIVICLVLLVIIVGCMKKHFYLSGNAKKDIDNMKTRADKIVSSTPTYTEVKQ